MFFIFSKLLLIFIMPFTWAMFLLVTALVSKKPKLKRRLLLSSVILLLVFSDPFLFNQFAKTWDIKPVPLKNKQRLSCAIVLGGFSGEDAYGNGFFNGAADRFIQGIELLNTGRVSHILITSGNGNLIHDSFEEADWAKTQLLLMKVPDTCILIENRSRNTIENAAFSKPVLEKSGLKPPYLLVTSAFHMRRSLGIFKKAKIDVIPYPCNYLGESDKLSLADFVPDSGIFAGWNLYIKEFVGTVVNYVR